MSNHQYCSVAIIRAFAPRKRAREPYRILFCNVASNQLGLDLLIVSIINKTTNVKIPAPTAANKIIKERTGFDFRSAG